MPYISQDLTSPQKNHKRIGSIVAFIFSVLWIIVALDYLIRSDWLAQNIILPLPSLLEEFVVFFSP